MINHDWHNQNAVIAERMAQQIIEVVRLLKSSKNLVITRINKKLKASKLV
jgi:hypothetical protein